MARILNTTKLSYHLEKIIEEASERIWLVSPYVKIHERMQGLIRRKLAEGVEMVIIYGKEEEQKESLACIADGASAEIYFCKNLHAKVFANENEAILTSLNLYQYSQVNNFELGCLLEKTSDPEPFRQLQTELEIIRQASTLEKRAKAKPSPEAESLAPSGKISTTQMAKRLKISTKEVFAFLATEGLIQREGEEWKLTTRGIQFGGEVVRSKRYGDYITWPVDIIAKD